MIVLCTASNNNLIKKIFFLAFFFCFIHFISASEIISYKFYEPVIKNYYIFNARNNSLKYNHDATIVFFDGMWIALWNANLNWEGRPGQAIYYSDSKDLKTWSAHTLAFSGIKKSYNPVKFIHSSDNKLSAMQWQPGLVKVTADNNKEELWALWHQNGGKGELAVNNGIWLSKLNSSNNKWKNEKVLFDGKSDPVIEGFKWSIFICNNGIVVNNGVNARRVIVPVVIRRKSSNDKGIIGYDIKRNSVIYTDDLGKTWKCSAGTFYDINNNWEPTVWQGVESDKIFMTARNNDKDETDPAKMMVKAQSSDLGETWSKCSILPVECSNSRMHVVKKGDRALMVHNDSYKPQGEIPGYIREKEVHIQFSRRYNLALFFSRSDNFDFTAGNSIEKELLDYWVHYPQIEFSEDNKKAAVIYSCEKYGADVKKFERSIRIAEILNLPDDSEYYIFPRNAGGKAVREIIDNKGVLGLYDDYSSAGIEMPEKINEYNIVFKFKFKIFSGNENTVLSLGNAVNSVNVIIRNNSIILRKSGVSSKEVVCGQHENDWAELEIIKESVEISGKRIARIRLNNNYIDFEYPFDIFSMYFGQGYYSEDIEKRPGNNFKIDLSSIRLEVINK